eukprot:s1616_g15.t1
MRLAEAKGFKPHCKNVCMWKMLDERSVTCPSGSIWDQLQSWSLNCASKAYHAVRQGHKRTISNNDRRQKEEEDRR